MSSYMSFRPNASGAISCGFIFEISVYLLNLNLILETGLGLPAIPQCSPKFCAMQVCVGLYLCKGV